MRNFKFKRSLTLVAASSLLSLTVVSIPTAAQANPVCTTANFVTTCVGATTDTAPYSMMVPANFNGTVYLYSHGYRPNVPVPLESLVTVDTQSPTHHNLVQTRPSLALFWLKVME